MRIRLHSTRTLLVLSLLSLSLLTACGDSNGPTAPGVEPEIVNNTDAFSFQVTDVNGYSGTLEYAWSNTGPMANVDQSAAIESGIVTLTLIDDAGNEVYSSDLSTDGSFASNSGSAGSWMVRVQMVRTRGTLNFTAEKRTP